MTPRNAGARGAPRTSPNTATGGASMSFRNAGAGGAP
jgi:hypothetical protein